MNKAPIVSLVVLAAACAVSPLRAGAGPAADAPSAAPSAAPSPSQSPSSPFARNGRPQANGSPRPVRAVPAENHTRVRVVSVDSAAATMTFVDVEGETSTWSFEPATLAHDPALKPDTQVTIIWKSDAAGQAIPKILGVMPVVSPAVGAASPATPAAGRQHRPNVASPKPSPAPSAAPR